MREVSYVVAVVTSLSSSWAVPVVVVVSASVAILVGGYGILMY